LSGLVIPFDLVQAVALFNSRNSMYQIEIYEYVDQEELAAASCFNAYYDQAEQRFQVDVMTGRIHDILVQPREELFDRGFLVDLYPLIDADSDLNRSDFFPNILSAMESPNGTLQRINNRFSIHTLISSREALGHIDLWTPTEMFRLIQDSQNMIVPFGTDMTRDQLLNLMLFQANMGFIDLDNYTANFDSEEFVQVLEAAKLMPGFSDLPSNMLMHDIVNEVRRIQYGEQLIVRQNIASINMYELFAKTIDDCIMLGIPAQNGGENLISLSGQSLGIGANTEHLDIAWEFVREFLLPPENDTDHTTISNMGFHIRSDTLEEQIEKAMTPIMIWHATRGEMVEAPRVTFTKQSEGNDLISLYSMSEKIADSLRAFIDSAVPTKHGINLELWHAISGDLNDFFSDVRSAEDTARIIQNRASRYVAEQGR
jgi:hypothetical protein